MKKQILNDLEKLEQANIITHDIAQSIRHYYQQEQSSFTQRLRIVFGILGGCLIGLGIILVLAHNWDQISRPVKTLFAFIPLLIGQATAFYVVLKKRDNIAWREGSGTFLFFAIGACIALIAQIYNIPGNMSNYLFTWVILSLPLIYLLRSSMVSLLYLIGITWLSGETIYWGYGDVSVHFYWLLLIAVLPDYFASIKLKPRSNFTVFHHWFIPLSITFSLGIIADKHDEWLFVAYMALFGLFHEIGNNKKLGQQYLRNNIYQIIASMGSVIILLILSFEWLWVDLNGDNIQFAPIIQSPEFIISLCLIIITSILILKTKTINWSIKSIHPNQILQYLFFLTFILGYFNALGSQILINLFLLGMGIFYLIHGSKSNQLGLLNYGLLIITALTICRFFDTDISFVLRGLMFIAVGLGFFISNYRILKKRQHNEL